MVNQMKLTKKKALELVFFDIILAIQHYLIYWKTIKLSNLFISKTVGPKIIPHINKNCCLGF